MNNKNATPKEQSALTTIESNNNLPATPTTVDEDKLIDETITSIKKIYEEARSTTIIKIGELIYEKIYGNDPDCFSHDRSIVKKTIKKRQIFEQLANKANELAEKGECLPKKTFLYNAVKLVVDQKQLADSPEYKQLSISHKIELLSIDNKDTKIEAAKEIQSKDLSVRDARKRVASLQEKRPKKTPITFYINNPEKIENEPDFLGKIIKAFKTKDNKKTVINSCQEKIDEIIALIDKSKINVDKLQTFKKQLNEVNISTKNPRKKKVAKKSE